MQHGKLSEAAKIAEQLCRKNKNDAESFYILGSIYGQMKRYEEAARQFRACIKIQPEVHIAHLNLGQALKALNDHSAAKAAFETALSLNPDDTDTRIQLCLLLLQSGEISQAEADAKDILDKHPGHTLALNLLGDIRYQQQRFQEAIQYYERSLSIEADQPGPTTFIGNSYFQMGLSDKAVHYFEKVARLQPHDISAFIHMGHCYKQNGKPDDARTAYEKALAIEPGNLVAAVGIIDLCERESDFEGAYQRLIEQIDKGAEDVDLAAAYVRLCHRFDRCDEAIAYAEKILDNDGIQQQDLARLEYALGRKFDKNQDYDRAFEHYQRANQLENADFDALLHTTFIDSLVETFNWQFFTQAARATVRSQKPIFIIGMPRSGTSLTEQILASHPDVYGAGELTDIGDEVQFFLRSEKHADYPRSMLGITSDELNGIANRYLQHLEDLAPTAKRVTDKQPTNFLHLGLISLAFPEAKIIHCTRNPMDNCLSIYFQAFSDANAYANDLHDIGLYYRQYQKLMEHTRGLIDNEVLDVAYEDLVNDQENMTRRLLEFVGLDWDERCLSFHENKRFVATPSYDQVREKIYTNAIERWKHYEKYLKPLSNGLGL